jgi:hypothetical protein
MSQSTVIFIPFDATGKAITLQSTFEGLKVRYGRRRVACLPPHITVDTIGSSKHLVLSMWTDAASVRAESNDMADALQRHGAGADLVARLRGTNARFEVSWNASDYKELWDDVSDLVMEEVEIVQEVVCILVELSGGIPLLNGATIFSFDPAHHDAGVAAKQIMSYS